MINKDLQCKAIYLKNVALSLLLWLIISLSLSAQDIPTLHLRLSKAPEDGEKAVLLWQLGKTYHDEKAFSKALYYYEQALDIGQYSFNVQDRILINEAIVNSGLQVKKYDLVEKAYENILAIHSQNNNVGGKNIILNKIAELYQKTGQSELALQQYMNLSEIYALQNDLAALINNYNNIGFLFHKKEDLRSALRFYQKAIHLVDQCRECLEADEISTLYLNFANVYASGHDMQQAEKYFKKALSFHKFNNIKAAEIKTYLGASYIHNNKSSKAITSLEESIALLETESENDEAKKILLQNYSLMTKVYEMEDNKTANGYSKLYYKLKEEIDHEQRNLLKEKYDNQLLIEVNESKLFNLISEKEKAEKKNIQFEIASQEKELLIKNKELDLLKQSQELQQAQIHNQTLEKEKMTQVLKMAEQELENENQKKKVIQQQLIAETIKAKVAQQQKKLLEANYEKELQAKQLKEAETQSQLRLSVIILMFLLLMAGIVLIIHSNKARKKLAQQNIFIQSQHSEIIQKNIHITEQNKELTKVQEEILLKSQSLTEQNIKLSEAQQIIEIQNQQMKSYMESLEEQVLDRTKQLTELNQELVKNNQQLEQFGFIVAHNLRGPVARLLGLSTIFQMSSGTEEDKVFLVTKIQQEITMLDTVISDLNVILQIKKGIENEVTDLKLDEKLIHVMDNIKEDIKESGSSITYDFSEANNIKFIQPYLHSILYNLISNAIKYRSPDRAPEIRLSTTRLNEQTVCLKVEDNGLGMDLNLHGKNIFGLYKRFHLHKEGKGLGLYLVKTQMEILGGKIEIESTPNQGTTFFLYFKQADKKQLELV